MAKEPPPVAFPFTCPAAPARLPRTAKDGQTVCDEQGNIWEYSAFEHAWIYRGALHVPPEVTESQDGLVTPDIFKRLQYLKQALDNGNNIPPTFKLNPNTDAYWYLFDSADRLINFRPESEHDLRIEFNRSRFYQLLMRLSCPGDKGPPGDPGPPGVANALLPEPCYGALMQPKPPVVSMGISPDGLAWSFAVKVPTPLNTDISIRLFDHQPLPDSDQGANAIILVPPSISSGAGGNGGGGSQAVTITVNDQQLDIDIARTSQTISYDPVSTLLSGTIYLASGSWFNQSGVAPPPTTTTTTRPPRNLLGNGPCVCGPSSPPTAQPSSWCMRVRQRGPVGDAGPDASCMLTAVSYSLPDLLQVVCPLVQLRQSSSDPNTILAYCAPVAQTVCVSQLTFPAQAGNIAPGSIVSTGRLAAVLPQLQACKDLVKYSPDLPVPTPPQLELPDYHPTPGCQDPTNFPATTLNWIPLTDQPADNADWAEPYPPGTQSKEYPWLIMVDDASEAPDVHACDPCPPGSGTTLPPALNTPTTTPAPVPYYLWRSVDLNTCYCQSAGVPPLASTDTVLGEFPDSSTCLNAKSSTCDSTQWYAVRLYSGGYRCFDTLSDFSSQGQVVAGPFNQLPDCFQALGAIEATTTPPPR